MISPERLTAIRAYVVAEAEGEASPLIVMLQDLLEVIDALAARPVYPPDTNPDHYAELERERNAAQNEVVDLQLILDQIRTLATLPERPADV